ncbi:MAG TPA: hypothetical protein VNQ76_06675 [Planctomicrobium sp.]|nr:hypothetical protein [Planctomicrobium sp.]
MSASFDAAIVFESVCREFRSRQVHRSDETGHREHHPSDAPGGPVRKPEEQVIVAPWAYRNHHAVEVASIIPLSTHPKHSSFTGKRSFSPGAGIAIRLLQQPA